MKRNKEKLICLLAILCVRTLFLFGDAFLGHISILENIDSEIPESNKVIVKDDDNINLQKVHGAESTIVETGYDKSEEQFELITEEMVELGLEESNIDIQETGFNAYNDIETLQKLYEKNQDPAILNLLVPKLIAGYQFNVAKGYLSKFNVFQDKNISIKDYIYVYVNTLSITDPTSIGKFSSFLDESKSRSLISTDDYNFYKGLILLRNGNYNQALSGFKNITTSSYQGFISQLSGAITNYSIQQGVPSYYETALISLVCLKNGYFSLANKLAVQVLLQNEEYLLPYQILAYSTFLTQDREKSIEYFYKLSSLDTENYEKYNFYIGISYYRYGNYEKSIAALVPLINSVYKNDAYRYLLLNYEKVGDKNKMIQTWQKQLGSTKIRESDYKYFFDQVFFVPFAKGEKSKVYMEYKQMSYDFLSKCYEDLGSDDATCIYGKVGIDIANSNWGSTKDDLLYLSENYPQSSIYQALGIYYRIMNDDEKAKTYFLKSLSMTDNSDQKKLIESILLDRGI